MTHHVTSRFQISNCRNFCGFVFGKINQFWASRLYYKCIKRHVGLKSARVKSFWQILRFSSVDKRHQDSVFFFFKKIIWNSMWPKDLFLVSFCSRNNKTWASFGQSRKSCNANGLISNTLTLNVSTGQWFAQKSVFACSQKEPPSKCISFLDIGALSVKN